MGFQAKSKDVDISARQNSDPAEEAETLLDYYKRVRHDTEHICAPLEIEDYGIQTVPEVSPPKWHLAHTSWFFETLLLKPYLHSYTEYHPQYGILFNSYYDTIGAYHPRPERGLLSRPTVAEVYAYRKYVDEQMYLLLSDTAHRDKEEILQRIHLGINHEQQHQELMLTDIKHIFAYNPLKPRYQTGKFRQVSNNKPAAMQWTGFEAGLYETGHAGNEFAYDNESPPHKTWLENFELANRLITNAEYLEFMQAGGYEEPDYWLSDAWKVINTENWHAPLYWEQEDNQWWNMTLSGMLPLDPHAPVTHVSFYEAAAFARWKNARLPTETEWEVAAKNCAIEGNLRESGSLQPCAPKAAAGGENNMQQMFGDVWEWTQSPYISYPGYKQQQGAFGEYNGKFMSSQMVLRGGSCVTPVDHIRRTYRNFFYPHERWQFTGIRLARDVV